jgi:hypothetical protein
MIKDCKIRIVANKTVVAKQANVIERNEKLYVVALSVKVDKVSTWYVDIDAAQHVF